MCIGWPSALFYPTSDGPGAQPAIRQAKVLCARCPLQEACLEHALRANETLGIWGGYTERERRRLLRARRDREMWEASQPRRCAG